jgi:hypothetical protein
VRAKNFREKVLTQGVPVRITGHSVGGLGIQVILEVVNIFTTQPRDGLAPFRARGRERVIFTDEGTAEECERLTHSVRAVAGGHAWGRPSGS